MPNRKIYVSQLTNLLDDELEKMPGMKRATLVNEILKLVFTIPKNFSENGLLLEEIRFIAEMSINMPADEIKQQAENQCRSPLNQIIWVLRQGLAEEAKGHSAGK